jgi:hypothetical protein
MLCYTDGALVHIKVVADVLLIPLQHSDTLHHAGVRQQIEYAPAICLLLLLLLLWCQPLATAQQDQLLHTMANRHSMRAVCSCSGT